MIHRVIISTRYRIGTASCNLNHTSPVNRFVLVGDPIRTRTETRALRYLPKNPDPGFIPGSTPGFGPGSGSNSVAVSSNKNTEPLDFILLAS